MQETQPVGFASQTKSKNKLKPIPETTSCKFMLTKYLAEQITYLEDEQKHLKPLIAQFWNLAVPSTGPTEHFFEQLNKLKDEQRYIKKQLQKLRYIQKVIKLFPDDDFSLKFAKFYNEQNKRTKKFSETLKPNKPDSRKVS
jgi:hypothetical protein